MDVAVYLFTGFLDGGKTSFVNETLNDPRFASGEETLLLLCEEGEVEVDSKSFEEKNIFTEVIDDPNEINPSNLKSLQKKYILLKAKQKRLQRLILSVFMKQPTDFMRFPMILFVRP